MNRNDLITVIMPAYNAGRYIGEAIKSIINQTYKNWELLIIDDGSTDNTVDVILNLKKEEQRIKLISRENRGLVESLNEGIENAKGNFIARMDADDICDKTRLEKQINYLYAHPEVHLVGTNVKMIFEDDVRDELKETSLKNEKLWNSNIDSSNRFNSNMEGFKVVHATWLIRKELFYYIGKYRKTVTEDAEFLFRCVINGYNVDKVPEQLYSYRIRNTSKSDLDRTDNKHKKEIINWKLDYLEENYKESMRTMKYMIWGADISGEIAAKVINERFPKAVCKGIIDGIKQGSWHEWTVCCKEESIKQDLDYIFICTRSGAKDAQKFLEEHGKKHIQDFMKIS